jgi:sec-independent protein translocase protein TatA
MPSWIGPWEIAIVLVIALLIFGPKKLPDLGKSMGKSISGFRQGMRETKEDVQETVRDIKEEIPTPEAEATASQAEAPKAETKAKS